MKISEQLSGMTCGEDRHNLHSAQRKSHVPTLSDAEIEFMIYGVGKAPPGVYPRTPRGTKTAIESRAQRAFVEYKTDDVYKLKNHKNIRKTTFDDTRTKKINKNHKKQKNKKNNRKISERRMEIDELHRKGLEEAKGIKTHYARQRAKARTVALNTVRMAKDAMSQSKSLFPRGKEDRIHLPSAIENQPGFIKRRYPKKEDMETDNTPVASFIDLRRTNVTSQGFLYGPDLERFRHRTNPSNRERRKRKKRKQKPYKPLPVEDPLDWDVYLEEMEKKGTKNEEEYTWGPRGKPVCPMRLNHVLRQREVTGRTYASLAREEQLIIPVLEDEIEIDTVTIARDGGTHEYVQLAVAGLLTVAQASVGTDTIIPFLHSLNTAICGMASSRTWAGVALHVGELMRSASSSFDLKEIMDYLRSGSTPALEDEAVFGSLLDKLDKPPDEDKPWWGSSAELVQIMINAPLGQRIIKLFSQLVALELLKKESIQFKLFNMPMIDIPAPTGCVSVMNAVDMLLTIVNRAQKVFSACMAERSMTPLAYDDLDFPQYEEVYISVLAMSGDFKCGNLGVHGVTEEQYEELLGRLITKGDGILKKKLNTVLRSMMVDKQLRLKKLQSDFEVQMQARGTKIMDYLVTLTGPTSCGKSVLAYPMMQFLMQANGFNSGREYIGKVTDGAKFDDMAKSNLICYYFDDLANSKKRDGETPAEAIIRIVNTIRNPARKADVDEKGRVFFNHTFTCITTNIEKLALGDEAREPSSILRRQALTVKMVTRPHLCVDNSIIADPQMQELHKRVFGEKPGIVQDYQWFNIRKVQVTAICTTNVPTTDYVTVTITKDRYPLTYLAVRKFATGLPDYYKKLRNHFPEKTWDLVRREAGAVLEVDYPVEHHHLKALMLTDTTAMLAKVDVTVFFTFLKEDSEHHIRRERRILHEGINSQRLSAWCAECQGPMFGCQCCDKDLNTPDVQDSAFSEPSSGGSEPARIVPDEDPIVGREIAQENFLYELNPIDWGSTFSGFGSEYVEVAFPREISKWELRVNKVRSDLEILFVRCLVAMRLMRFTWEDWLYENAHRMPHSMTEFHIVDGAIGNLLFECMMCAGYGPVRGFLHKMRVRRLLLGLSHATFWLPLLVLLLLLLGHFRLYVTCLILYSVAYYNITLYATMRKIQREGNAWTTVVKSQSRAIFDMLPYVAVFGVIALGLSRLRKSSHVKLQESVELEKPFSYSMCDDVRVAKGVMKTMTRDQFSRRVEKNVAELSVRTGENTFRRVHMVGLQGTLWLVPRHSLDTRNGNLSVRYCRKGAEQKPEIGLSTDSVVFIPGKDLAIVSLPDLGHVKSLVEALPGSELVGSRLSTLLHCKGEMTQHRVTTERRLLNFTKPKQYYWKCSSVRPYQVYTVAHNTTSDGSCGSPVISHASKENLLLGLHVLKFMSTRNGDVCGIETLYFQEFEDARDELLRRHVFVGCDAELPVSTVDNVVQTEDGEVHKRHALRHISHPEECEVLGFWNARTSNVSKVKDSLLIEGIVREFGLPRDKYGPPPFKYFEDGSPNWPWQVALEQITHRGAKYHTDVLPNIRDMMVKQYKPHIGFFRPLTDFEVRHGTSDGGVNSINMKSSMGHPYNMPKKKMSPSEDPPYVLPECAWDGLRRFERSIDERCVEVMLFKASLKDEPVLTGQKKKARVFQASNIVFTLWVRKHLGWLLSAMALHNRALGVAVGMDALGVGWDRMIRDIMTDRDDIIQYDYKKFDQHVSPQMKSEIVRFITELMASLGADKKWIQHVRDGLSQWVFPSSVFDGVILRLRGSNPSGIGTTTIFNCLDNAMRTYCAVWAVTGRLDFASFTHLMTYGDDAFLQCSDERVTLQSMASAFGEMGIVITPTDKAADLSKARGRVNWRDLDFLSRSVVFHPKLGRYVGALQDDSLFKGLMVRLDGDVSDEEQAVGASRSALYEAFARGEEFYDAFRIKLGRILLEHGLENCVPWKMSYDELLKPVKKRGYLSIADGEPVAVHDLRCEEEVVFARQLNSDDAPSRGVPLFSGRISVLGLDRVVCHRAKSTHPTENRLTSTTTETRGQTQFYMDRPSHDASDISQMDTTRHSAVVPGMQLADWFARPIQIRELRLDDTDFSEIFDPWTAYLRAPTIRDKLEGYAFFTGTLTLKFIVTGQQFLSGRYVVAYDPLPSIARENGLTTSRDPVNRELLLCQMSQRQHLYLNPTTNTGGEMVLPFFFRDDMCPIEVSNQLGRVHFETLQALQTVRSTFPKATVTVYASIPDLILGGPTTEPIIEDEVVDSKLSSKLSVVSRFANLFSSIPIIGPYATAAAVFARNASNTALRYGFSRPNAVGADKRVHLTSGAPRSHAVGEVSNTIIAFDPKCTTTVDPAVAGIHREDEMALKVLRERESYFDSFLWPEEASPGSLLASYPVGPLYSTNTASRVCPTSLAYATYPFRYWRGSIKFRFMVIATAVHTGIVRFVFDSLARTTGLLDVVEQNKVRVFNMDLSKTRDMTIEIPYVQAKAFLECQDFGAPDFTNANGILRVYVMNQLVSSSETPYAIKVAVFISAGDDFEAWDPRNIYQTYRPVVEDEEVQISTMLQDSAPENPDGHDIASSATIANSSCIFYGDPIASVRYMLKRFYCTAFLPQTNGLITLRLPIYPNLSLSNDIIYHQGPFQYWAAAYVGWRGSLNKKIMGNVLTLNRLREGVGNEPFVEKNPSDEDISKIVRSVEGGEDGFASNPVNVSFPWYAPQRFNFALTAPEIVTKESERFGLYTNGSFSVREFTAAGEDFMFVYYIGAPRLAVIA